MRAATNPAPNWVRERFIVEGKKKARVFVPSFLDDNPGIEAESYRAMLQELPEIERMQLEKGEWFFADPGDVFKSEDFVIVEPKELPTFLAPKVVRFWDMAGTKVSTTNLDPDWTAGVLMVYEKGITYILDVQRCREESPDVEKLIKNTAIDDGVEVSIRVEQEPGSSGKSLINMYSRKVVPGYDFGPVPASGDKYTRAKPLASAVRNGNVRVLRGDWNNDFLEEMGAFKSDGKSLTHDDQVDAASHAFAEITGLVGKQKNKVRIVV
jgi:predicted phage terminase large subunit-like protein